MRRTATARAATDLELQALTCDARRLPVVTGYPPAECSREAGAEVDEMLDRVSSARVNRLMIKMGRDTSAEIH